MTNGKSAWKNQGKKAYCPSNDPTIECPYKLTSFIYARRCWLDGWQEEKEEVAKISKEEQDSSYFKHDWIPAKDDIFGAIQQIQNILEEQLRRA